MARLFLAGDVMLGRGIDQILRHPGAPRLYEGYVQWAADYVRLAEAANGPIPRGVELDYVWGDAADLRGADFGIVNLETAVTNGGAPELKGINYRMNPRNLAGLQRLGIDCCVLANNHVLDWGEAGLLQTLGVLGEMGMATAGAGRNAAEAAAPAVLGGAEGRILVFGFAGHSSGVPRHWSAREGRPGVNYIELFNEQKVRAIKAQVLDARRDGDVVVASIHWGSNWGYDVLPSQVAFAHALIDEAVVDVVHGHSSHHPKGWEIYHGKLILYGCGDFINDYEGISGHEEYRPDLTLMYLPVMGVDGSLTALDMIPFKIRKFRLNRASPADARWLCALLNAQCRSPRARMAADAEGILHLERPA